MENTKARREAAVLVVVVFLLGAILGAVGNHLWGTRVMGMIRADNPARLHGMADLAQQLKLTPEQQKQVAGISDDVRTRWKALYTPLDAEREQMRMQGRQKIRSILTPEQQPKFDAYIQRLDEQRKKDAEAAAAAKQ
jgi:Spy/CpxP family protein refolding chaperone